ncbi:MAG: M50 family metallopeptidase [Leptolyngbya sp. SIO4C1]|nr:M50 family metallopeptidase [Leptolyngbya sp. SIO4C1]
MRNLFPDLSDTAVMPKRDRLRWLMIAAVATVVLWQVPLGEYLLYPFTILATWFHEMGHGLTAMLLGGNFQKLVLYPNGSGVAISSGRVFGGALGHAMVSAGGPMGPPLAGAALILASRQAKTARWGLIALGALLIASTLVWVRSLTGWLVLPLLGAAILYIALRTKVWVKVLTVQFLGVQACISTFHQLDYLFTYQATIGGQTMLSDTGQISKALLLPHWIWGSLLAIAAVLLLAKSLQLAYRDE